MMRWPAVAAIGALVLGDALFVTSFIEPFKVNPTHSIPAGIYVRTWSEPTVGSIVWFPPPPAAGKWMEDNRLELPLRWFDNRLNGLLKPVAAMAGDTICRDGWNFEVNGELRALVPTLISGRVLPIWSGCVTLDEDHLAVFSTGEENGFDSRMYGPVRKASVRTYTILWRF